VGVVSVVRGPLASFGVGVAVEVKVKGRRWRYLEEFIKKEGRNKSIGNKNEHPV
jgi:hypothetical protein